jgi:hypothetical protein
MSSIYSIKSKHYICHNACSLCTTTAGTLTLFNSSKLLLQNTLITDPQQIPNGLVCTTGRDGGARFRFEDGTTIHGRRQGQSTTVQSSQLNQNGRYVCSGGGREWPFYIYFNNGE